MNTQIDFENTNQLNEFLIHNNQEYWFEITELTSKYELVKYNCTNNKILYFDYITKKGKIYSYNEFNENINKKRNLRLIISRYFPGIQYSRNNYIEEYENLKNLNESIIEKYYSKVSHIVPIVDGKIHNEDLNHANEFIESLTIKERMEYEIPILMAFIKYSNINYKSTIILNKNKNQFGEEILLVDLKLQNNFTIRISTSVFKTMYPDIDRDDIDDTKIKLNSIKNSIDSFNQNQIEFSYD